MKTNKTMLSSIELCLTGSVVLQVIHLGITRKKLIVIHCKVRNFLSNTAFKVAVTTLSYQFLHFDIEKIKPS